VPYLSASEVMIHEEFTTFTFTFYIVNFKYLILSLCYHPSKFRF